MTMVEGVGDVRVIGFSMNTDAKLGELMHKAAAKNNMKHVAWVRKIMIDAVRAEGFEYEADTKESLKEQVARMKVELEQAREALRTQRMDDDIIAEAAARVAKHNA